MFYWKQIYALNCEGIPFVVTDALSAEIAFNGYNSKRLFTECLQVRKYTNALDFASVIIQL